MCVLTPMTATGRSSCAARAPATSGLLAVLECGREGAACGTAAPSPSPPPARVPPAGGSVWARCKPRQGCRTTAIELSAARPATKESVIPCLAEASGRVGTPGLTVLQWSSAFSRDDILSAETPAMRSFLLPGPVVATWTTTRGCRNRMRLSPSARSRVPRLVSHPSLGSSSVRSPDGCSEGWSVRAPLCTPPTSRVPLPPAGSRPRFLGGGARSAQMRAGAPPLRQHRARAGAVPAVAGPSSLHR